MDLSYIYIPHRKDIFTLVAWLYNFFYKTSVHRTWRKVMTYSVENSLRSTEFEEAENRQSETSDSAKTPCVWVVNVSTRGIIDVLSNLSRANCLFYSIHRTMSSLLLLLFLWGRWSNYFKPFLNTNNVTSYVILSL